MLAALRLSKLSFRPLQPGSTPGLGANSIFPAVGRVLASERGLKNGFGFHAGRVSS
jgi:hypothetical protein